MALHTEQRPLRGALGPQAPRIAGIHGGVHLPGPSSAHRHVETSCARPSRPVNVASISDHKALPRLAHNVSFLPSPAQLNPFSRDSQIASLEDLVARLQAAPTVAAKLSLIMAEPAVVDFFGKTPSGATVAAALPSLPPEHAFCLACLPAIGQAHVLRVLPVNGSLAPAIASLAASLAAVDHFYDCLGGLAGYQLQCLRLIEEHRCGGSTSSVEDAPGPPPGVDFLVPSGLDLRSPEAAAAVTRGLSGLPRMAEIYPLGGAGDRLGLRCPQSGDPLPTAVLPYAGRSLLEALMRDLQAREYLYYRVHGRQVTTPVAVMTSAVKDNHAHVTALFERAGWFGRGRDAFRLFEQPLVPVVAARDGAWLLDAPLAPALKPGGHGVIWKLMLDAGVFDWLAGQGRTAAIVRQISNPMAGQDSTLLALAGEGLAGGRAFGFASCERVVGAAEGMNVLLRQEIDPSAGGGGNGGAADAACPRHSFRITNVEYTEFERLGIEDKSTCVDSQTSCYPANTNVLFLGLAAAEAAVRAAAAAGSAAGVLPGMILNLKKEVAHRDPATGAELRSRGGRLECTMQNLADAFGAAVAPAGLGPDGAPPPEALDTFMVYGPRRRVTSSAKRQRSPGSTKIHQTPDGSLYDLMANAGEMLAAAGWEVPPLGSVSEYLDKGPGFLFFFHPALGPLWSVVGQKARRGRLAPGAELQLEVAEADVEGLDVEGSLLVVADSPLGRSSAEAGDGPRLAFGDRCGRVRLRDVRVRNAGVDWDAPGNCYWRHEVARRGAARVTLLGASEFEAQGVELQGDVEFVVPDGHRMRVSPGEDPQGPPRVELFPLAPGGGPSWRWVYGLDAAGGVALTLETE